jgi:hypothetical protein
MTKYGFIIDVQTSKITTRYEYENYFNFIKTVKTKKKKSNGLNVLDKRSRISYTFKFEWQTPPETSFTFLKTQTI